MRAVALVLLALASCDGPPASLDAGRDASSDAGPRACRTHTSCGEGQRCAVGSIAEIAVEPGERGACTPVEALLGFEPRPLVVRPGGSALADRLCLAQGISPGAGNDALRARQVELLRASGARLVRLDFRWASIERVNNFSPVRRSKNPPSTPPMTLAGINSHNRFFWSLRSFACANVPPK